MSAQAPKRNCLVKNYLHTASKRVIDWCVNHEIGSLIFGYNQTWKKEIKLGKKNNQKFVNIPNYRLIEMLTYKAKLREIKVIITEVYYRSQSSCLDGDNLLKSGDKKQKLSRKRVKSRVV